MALGDIAALGFIVIIVDIIMAVWAVMDSKKRGYSVMKMIMIFLIVLLLSILGLIIYLIMRPTGKFVRCPRCKKPAFSHLRECPHCGLDRPRAKKPAPEHDHHKIKCPHCGQLVEPSWKTCPYCSRKITISKTIIDEVFLIYKDGRLIRHYTRRLKPDVDQDILSGMLTAVQEFIKDSFRGEIGELNHMEFGKFQILMGHGRFVTVAAVLMGDEIEPFRPQIIKAIDQMEADYEVILRDWKGDVEQVNVLGRYITDLIEGRYA